MNQPNFTGHVALNESLSDEARLEMDYMRSIINVLHPKHRSHMYQTANVSHPAQSFEYSHGVKVS